MKQNPTELERIVKNHLVRGLVRSKDLADDLVGPSVANTKLRSNVYHSEDRNWKDVDVITINGANVLKTDMATQDKYGLVHVVDRVLFPPTVGDVVQTLQVILTYCVTFIYDSSNYGSYVTIHMASQMTNALTFWFTFIVLIQKVLFQADPEQRFTTFIKALQATRLDKEITDYNSKS